MQELSLELNIVVLRHPPGQVNFFANCAHWQRECLLEYRNKIQKRAPCWTVVWNSVESFCLPIPQRSLLIPVHLVWWYRYEFCSALAILIFLIFAYYSHMLLRPQRGETLVWYVAVAEMVFIERFSLLAVEFFLSFFVLCVNNRVGWYDFRLLLSIWHMFWQLINETRFSWILKARSLICSYQNTHLLSRNPCESEFYLTRWYVESVQFRYWPAPELGCRCNCLFSKVWWSWCYVV